MKLNRYIKLVKYARRAWRRKRRKEFQQHGERSGSVKDEVFSEGHVSNNRGGGVGESVEKHIHQRPKNQVKEKEGIQAL